MHSVTKNHRRGPTKPSGLIQNNQSSPDLRLISSRLDELRIKLDAKGSKASDSVRLNKH
jgi:hypothetical protein